MLTDRLDLSPTQRNLADALWQTDAVKIGEFGLKIHDRYPKAPKSPFYFSMRRGDVKPGTYDFLVGVIAASLAYDTRHLLESDDPEKQIDCVIGIPNAGNEIAKAYSKLTSIPQKTMVKYGTKGPDRKILPIVDEGLDKGEKVLGVDDLITLGDTKEEFISAVKANKAKLLHIAVAVDREQGGIKSLRDKGISISASVLNSSLLAYYLQEGHIDEKTYQEILAYPQRLNDYIASFNPS